MRKLTILAAALLNSCSQPSIEEVMFVREEEVPTLANPGALFLHDALSRLTEAEKERFESVGEVAGFLFTGQKYKCVVVASLRTDVLNHAPDPVFCYDKNTSRFVERL